MSVLLWDLGLWMCNRFCQKVNKTHLASTHDNHILALNLPGHNQAASALDLGELPFGLGVSHGFVDEDEDEDDGSGNGKQQAGLARAFVFSRRSREVHRDWKVAKALGDWRLDDIKTMHHIGWRRQVAFFEGR